MEYTFLVKARYPEGILSGGVSVIARPDPPPEEPPPADVISLTATPGPGNVLVSWTEPADSDFAGVELSWSSGGDILLVAQGTNHRTVTGLDALTDYTFTVRARYPDGVLSEGVNVTARPDPAPPRADVSNPTATPGTGKRPGQLDRTRGR